MTKDEQITALREALAVLIYKSKDGHWYTSLRGAMRVDDIPQVAAVLPTIDATEPEAIPKGIDMPTDADGWGSTELFIKFDGPPGPESGRFVEVERPFGRSIRAGRWEKRGDFWVLILTSDDFSMVEKKS